MCYILTIKCSGLGDTPKLSEELPELLRTFCKSDKGLIAQEKKSWGLWKMDEFDALDCMFGGR